MPLSHKVQLPCEMSYLHTSYAELGITYKTPSFLRYSTAISILVQERLLAACASIKEENTDEIKANPDGCCGRRLRAVLSYYNRQLIGIFLY